MYDLFIDIIEIQQTTGIQDPLIPSTLPMVPSLNTSIRDKHLIIEIQEVFDKPRPLRSLLIKLISHKRLSERPEHECIATACMREQPKMDREKKGIQDN